MIQNAQSQWTYSNLSEPKYHMGAATIGNKAYFAGGYDKTKFMDKVEVYDVSTGTWEISGKLSKARQVIGGSASCKSKIFFAGGYDENISYDNIDIYDTLTKEWSVAHLSVDRFSLSAISHGDTVMFAGGVQFKSDVNPVFKNTIDIYNSKTGVWTVDHLSIARMGMAASVVGDLAIFAGGMDYVAGGTNAFKTLNRVDIYNFSTKTWSIASLSQARAYASAVTVGNKVIIAGGVTSLNNPTNRVDIYDASTGEWTTATLSVARAGLENAAVVAGKAYFVGGGTFTGSSFTAPSDYIDIYDPVNNTWSIDFLSQPVASHSVVGAGNHLIVAGGKTVGELIVKKVEIFKVPPTGITSNPMEDEFLKVYPNPVSEKITVEFPGWGQTTEGTVTIYGIAGQQFMSQEMLGLKSEIAVSNLPAGIYFIKLVSTNQTGVGRFVKN